MNIVVVSCVAPPEPVVSGRVNFDICEYLSQKGHFVTLITPYPSRPIGKFNINNKSCEESFTINEKFIHVKINSYQSPQLSLWRRVYESFSFGYKSIKYINENIGCADIIYATPWPFIGQLTFVLLKKDKKIPVVMNVQDLYPESFFTKYKSRIPASFLKPFYLIDTLIAVKSTHLTVVSDTMKLVYVNNRRINTDKVTVIENWQDEDIFIKRKTGKLEILNNYCLSNISEKFIFLYLGNIGPIAGLEGVIRDFARIDGTESCLVIAGTGTSKGSCIALTNLLGLHHVYFVDISTGMESVVDLQSIADVLLLPIHPEASASSIPSKLIAYMFSGKPILSSAKADSTTGLAIMENKCGFLINNNESWADRMAEISRLNPIDLKQIGKNASEFGLSNYSKRKGLEKVERLFVRILENNKK
jgi:glycosyltransferase involved in cell wall biosynthesis